LLKWTWTEKKGKDKDDEKKSLTKEKKGEKKD
jgi:hypothetical protein